MPTYTGLVGPSPAPVNHRPSDANPFAGYRLVDLTHTLDDQTPPWPTDLPFRHKRIAWGKQPDGYWYSSYDLSLCEHCGTHLDAPIHFAKGKASIGDIDLADLSGPLAVIETGLQCQANPDYLAAPSDVEADEAAHGVIVPGMIVFFRTGWSRRWPRALDYLGDDRPGRTDALHFPGVSARAAQCLVDRGVAMVGIDTASIDGGRSSSFPVHRMLAANSTYIVENLAGLNELPGRGAYAMAFPMKIGQGSGAPCRVGAMVPTT